METVINSSIILVEVTPTLQEIVSRSLVPSGLCMADLADPEQIKQDVRQYLLKVKSSCSISLQERVMVRVSEGQPAEQIIEAARRTGAGLIVMASHMRTRLGGVMHNSVAEEVVKRSGLPVILVNSRFEQVWKIKALEDNASSACQNSC